MFSFKDDTFKNAFEKKYQLLQQGANTDQFRADTDRMGVPIDRMNAETSRFGAQTARMIAPSEIAGNYAQAYNATTEADERRSWMEPGSAAPSVQNDALRNGIDITGPEQTRRGLLSPLDVSGVNLGFGSGMGSAMAENDPRRYYAKGIARVPGKGSGKVDTVPAKLAPGEAVLNKAAADKMGRGLIAALNQMGARKMGLV